ncbi:hypothetical protein [Dolichospermum phage Dfl-JY45]
MDTKSITLITRLEIDPGSLDDAALRERMRFAAEYPFKDGMFTGETDAEIESWSVNVRIGPGMATASGRALLADAVLGRADSEPQAREGARGTRHPDDQALGAVQATIENLCLQIEQMRGMFKDEDRTIAGALQDAEDASEILGRLRGRFARSQAGVTDTTPQVIVTIADAGVTASSTQPIRLTVLDADVPRDWSAPTALVQGDAYQVSAIDVDVSPRAVDACARQIEHALEVKAALGDDISDDLQQALDELVSDTVMGRFVADHGSLDDDALSAAEAEASAINNEGVAAQVCEIVAHGDIERLQALAGLAPSAGGGAGPAP